MIRHARQIASVWRMTSVLRRVVEAVLAHHQLRVHPPAFDEFRRVGEQTRQRRMAAGRIELQVMTGVRLVDARVADRGAVVLAHGVQVAVDRRRDDVDALRLRVERGGREVRGERDDVAQVLGRLDDVDPLVVGTVTRSCSMRWARARRIATWYCLEGLAEGRRMVGLDALDDVGFVGARVDLARGRLPRGASPPPASDGRARGSRPRRGRRTRGARPSGRAARARSPNRPCRRRACLRARS